MIVQKAIFALVYQIESDCIMTSVDIITRSNFIGLRDLI